MTNSTSPFCAELLALTKTSAPEVDPGYMDAQQGMQRAIRAGNSGVGQFMADPDLIKQRLKGLAAGGLIGGGVGAGLGHLAARGRPGGAAMGGFLGGNVGMSAGIANADVQHLKGKGINPKLLGLLGAKFSPEAAEQYLPKQASAAKQLLGMAKKHKGKVGLVAGGAVAHDQGSQAYKDWKLGRQYRKSMERGRR